MSFGEPFASIPTSRGGRKERATLLVAVAPLPEFSDHEIPTAVSALPAGSTLTPAPL